MVQFRNQEKEILFKVVYYGPALGGKTTNLETLHQITDPEGITKMTSLKTAEDRTLFFDLLPFDLGEIQGYHIRIQVYTVPGQVHYNTTRKIVLSGADSIVFVADSQRERLEENRISWENMKTNLLENKMNPDDIPVIVQCNKIDLEGTASPEEILEALNLDGHRHVTLSSAIDGEGVIDTFRMAVSESLAVFIGKFRLVSKGITREKINEGLMRFFEPFEKKRLAARELERGGGQDKVPLTGLSQEEQLSAALVFATELAEQQEKIERLSRLNEARLREMTLFYDIGVAVSPLKDNDSLVLAALRLFSQLMPSWTFSLFRLEEGETREVGCFGAEKDPLFGAGEAAAAQIASGLLSAGTRDTVDDLPGLVERASGAVAAVPESVTPLFLGGASDRRYAVLAYSSAEDAGSESAKRALSLFEKLVAPKVAANALSEELEKANDMLERRVIERTAELSGALERLKELDAIKHECLGDASGEMRRSIADIRAMSETLLRHPDKWFDKGKANMAAIVAESEKLEKVMERLLSFAAVKQPFTGKPCDLSLVLDESVSALAPRLKAKKITAVVQKDSDSMLFPINGEDAAVLMRQVLDNAVKFTPEGTSVKVFLMEDDKRVIFSVRDFGEGFSGDPSAVAAEAGARPDRLSLKNGGMGLYLVREVVGKYSGTMHVESMEPGTIVLIEFPKS